MISTRAGEPAPQRWAGKHHIPRDFPRRRSPTGLPRSWLVQAGSLPAGIYLPSARLPGLPTPTGAPRRHQEGQLPKTAPSSGAPVPAGSPAAGGPSGVVPRRFPQRGSRRGQLPLGWKGRRTPLWHHTLARPSAREAVARKYDAPLLLLFPELSRIFQELSRTFQKLSRSFQKVSRTFQKVSRMKSE